ncbi:hypothetical protein G5V59_15075 [Nocardioides sp. W3-2-3]|uniref:type VII secretion protein EccB n=1 Tax=Nocardioides convexus TaxID=2712224 RepID=UPI0024184EB7|nr:type VII secretion protein EccB [Nocardioides convexus]NHA00811.1 hypothetical protein [Nocardioides convexus]
MGDYVERGDTRYVYTGAGFAPLTDFAFTVLQHTMAGKRLPRALQATTTDPPFKAVAAPYRDSSWPETRVQRSAAATDTVCGQPGDRQGHRACRAPGHRAHRVAARRRRRRRAAQGRRRARLRRAGALRRLGRHRRRHRRAGRRRRPQAYSVAGPTEVENLGYKSVPPVVVPVSWVQLFTPGPDLSILDALCPPRTPTQDARKPAGPTCS